MAARKSVGVSKAKPSARAARRGESVAELERRRQVKLVESFYDLLDNVVDPSTEFEGWLGPNDLGPGPDDRKPVDYDGMRRTVRRLVWESGFALGGLENLTNYLVGTGLAYSFSAPAAAGEDELEAYVDAAKRASDYWRAWADREKWADLEQAAVFCAFRDGELFLRWFDVAGDWSVRYVDPNDVEARDDPSAPLGIRFDPRDQQRPTAYRIAGEWVPAELVQHMKFNVDPDVPRGVPMYWPVRWMLLRADKLLRNMARIGEVQAAIAMIRKRTVPGNPTATTNFLDAAADKRITDRESGRTVRQQKIRDGSIVDVPMGTDLEFPIAGASLPNYPPGVQAVLRSVAARLVMPEYMFTGDASNANMASTFAATSPATKNFQRHQGRTAAFYSAAPRRVIAGAVRVGALPPICAQLVVKATGPIVEMRDPEKDARVRQIEKREGVLSVQTWTAETGRDYQREQRLRAEHQANYGIDQPLDDPNAANGEPTDGADPADANPNDGGDPAEE